MSETAEQAKAELRIEWHSTRPRRQWHMTQICACGWCWRERRAHCPKVPDASDPPAGAVWLWASEGR